MQTRNVHRPFAAIALSCSLLFAGACGDDKPTADEIGAEAKEQAAQAAEDAKDTAETIKDTGQEVAEDVADGPDDADERAVKIAAPSDGATLAAGDVEVKLEVSGVTIVKADGDTSGQSGHFHVFVDQDPVGVGEVIPTAPMVVHSADNPVKVEGLAPGKHRLVVVIGDGTHKRLDIDAAEVTITVT